MKGRTALIEPSEFDWSEAKLRSNGGNTFAGVGVVARQEYDLPLPWPGRIRSELVRRQMIEGFYQARSDKCLGHDFRREETSELLRSNMKGILTRDDKAK